MTSSEHAPCLLVVGAGYSGRAIAELALTQGLGVDAPIADGRLDIDSNPATATDADIADHTERASSRPTSVLSASLDVVATRTSAVGVAELAGLGMHSVIFDGQSVSTELNDVLQRMTHLVVCVAPSREEPLNDPVHSALAPLLETACPRLQWMAYLSTIGVYGDHQGKWIDESAPCTSTQTRSILRRQAEVAWQASAECKGVPISVLRLSGIYGPSRNAVREALAGRGRRLVKHGQVFNRIHVYDIARATLLAAGKQFDGVLNITDHEPAPSHVVVEYAHQLVGQEPPPVIEFENAELSPMARSFYSENKRISNARSREALGMVYRYPTYREGLQAELEGKQRGRQS